MASRPIEEVAGAVEGEADRERFMSAMRADQKRIARGAPRPSDAIRKGTCFKYGMTNGPHAAMEVCISSLRSRLALVTGK